MNCDKCEYNKYCTELNYLNLADECRDMRKFVNEIREDAIDECIMTIVGTQSQIALNEPYDKHLFTVIADRQHEIIDLLEQLKENSNGMDTNFTYN